MLHNFILHGNLLGNENKYAKGGGVGKEETVFNEEPLRIEKDSKGNLKFDFDSKSNTGWSFDTDDVGVAVAIICGSKFKSNAALRSIPVSKKQIEATDAEDTIYWLSGGNVAWRFGNQYKHSFEKTYKDLWKKSEAGKVKSSIAGAKTIGDIIDVFNEEYLDYPYFYGNAIDSGYTEDDEEMEKGGVMEIAQLVKGGHPKQKGSSVTSLDKQEKAKRVGYRYSDKLAKKLGVSPNTKPTEEHIEKYLHKGVYFENRKNRSDKSRMKKLADGGGVKQTGTTDKAHDVLVKAKRVGYRYTDERAKKLGLSPNAKPTQEHIDKYLGNGVYEENRKNRSDKSRMKKLKRGGNAGNKSMMQKIQDEVKKLKAEAPKMFEKHTDFVKKAAANLKAKGEL